MTLFDLWIGLELKEGDPKRIVQAFRQYMDAEGSNVGRVDFERNLALKTKSRQFNDDLRPLLAPGIRYDAGEAAGLVTDRLLSLL